MTLHSGMGELQAVLKEWERIAERATEDNRKGIVLPNYLWVVKSGSGITYALDALSSYLKEQRLMEFSGDDLFTEFVLDFSPQEENFPSFVRYVDVMSRLNEFGGVYKGVIAIDITEWVSNGAVRSLRFLRFLEYLGMHIDEQMIVFVCSDTDAAHVKAVESVLISYLRVRTLHLDFPSDKEFLMYLDVQLRPSGLHLSPKARKTIGETLALLRTRPGFDGYKTVGELAKDLIYTKYSGEKFSGNVITAADAQRYAPDGDWLKQYDDHPKRMLGFK